MIFDSVFVDWRVHEVFSFFPVDSDAHSTTSSVSPAQSPSYSNQSDDGSDIESKQRRSTPSIFSFLDRSYWKRYLSYHATGLISRGYIKLFSKVFSIYGHISLCSGKRCAAELSTRVALVRWLLILGSSSLAAVPKNKRWDPHKWPQASLTHFPSSSRKTWRKTGDCFYRTPLQGHQWHPPLSPVADLHVSVPPMKSVRFFFYELFPFTWVFFFYIFVVHFLFY